MKKCNKCKEIKPLSNFSKNKNNKDGLAYQCRVCQNRNSKLYRNNNPDYNNKYYQENIEYYKEYYQNNSNKMQSYALEYYQNNQEELNKKNAKYFKSRKEKDPIFKLKCNVRNNIGIAFKRACKGSHVKSSKSLEILGCEFDFFIKYLESKFTEGMTLENYGEWEIDHIIPVSSAKNKEEIYKLNHYKNFQPLWKSDNRKKSNKLK